MPHVSAKASPWSQAGVGEDRDGRRVAHKRENLSELKATLVGAGLPQISDDEVRSVATRTLLLTGEHSPMFSLCLTDRVEELLPRATRVEIPDASHFAHEDNPRAVNEAILTFLAQADAPASEHRPR